MMRRASIGAALLGLAFAGVPAVASAAPTVTLKAKIVPVPKNLLKKKGPSWPGTGNYLGAGAALEFKFTIKGSEYPDGHPDPLRRVKVYLPKGTKITTKGFKSCPVSDFENHEPENCPKGSLASPPGEASGVVDFGESPVHETVLVQAYFAPGGGLTFYIEGRSPAEIEEFASGTIKQTKGKWGVEAVTEVPLITTVPGGFDASAEQINVKIGAAYMKGKKLVSYGTVPKTCPKSGFPGKAELFFGEGSESTWLRSTVSTKVPCPKGKAKAATSKGKGHHGKGKK
jgi:hypothetical protein